MRLESLTRDDRGTLIVICANPDEDEAVDAVVTLAVKANELLQEAQAEEEAPVPRKKPQKPRKKAAKKTPAPKKAAEKAPAHRCAGMTAAGTACSFQPTQGDYCKHHQPADTDKPWKENPNANGREYLSARGGA